ncbi:type II toxin-antitoxin system Phd/YefM family antitoxin [Enterococcus hulanensis]|uniref:type II toxin-antitoxin system Phd/YefM family antitoxin n=1 Tax=Enterococcus TaxID=1350 RepID=UPI000B5A2524|nr:MULTISPECIES: type II toxin-antitoxin system Phd/YefM family antitoxin [Enterococcus]MBO0410413.1 type II toxin-antitoxin system Phd/YefM family antitoxin [Enterococcus hulanensis]OTO14411.1 toxin-antitoxin system, antitoxin component [Enterococcus sp. 3H8_DIV0648]OTO14412.1 toxin-antitoxin system, antitoxin component [Enterococcus sp. 3H8_DIV0648]
MEAVAYSNFRQNLKSYMRQVNDDAEALIVTSKDIDETVVVMAKRDYDSLQETLRILSNSYLMEKIQKGEQQFQNGNFTSHDLIEEESDE